MAQGVDMDEVLFEDACGQAEAIRSGRVAAAELVSAYLDRIERFDPVVRAFVTVAADPPRWTADTDELEGRDRPFDGVTVSIKDVEDVAGLPTTHSCEALAGHVATEDGPLTRRLRRGGFMVLGKTNVPEFCSDMTVSKLNGPCRNPWDLERTPGGSSGGAAAAVSGGLCAIAHGTDGAGSVRVPAAWCGLVGLKPSRGLVAFGPDEGPTYFGTSVPGVLCRSVRDAAAFLDVMAPPGPWTPARDRLYAETTAPTEERLRIGLCTTPPMGAVDPECAAAATDAGVLMEELGHRVESAQPAWDVILQAAFGPMEVPGAAALVSVDDLARVEPRNRPMVGHLASLTVLDHFRWVEAARTAGRHFRRLWSAIDVLVTPTVGMLAPQLTWARWDDDNEAHRARFATFPNFAQPFNVSGQPAISLPLGWSAGGLPIGVQLVGRPLGESTLFQLAAELERARPWAERISQPARSLHLTADAPPAWSPRL
jgi:amidase